MFRPFDTVRIFKQSSLVFLVLIMVLARQAKAAPKILALNWGQTQISERVHQRILYLLQQLPNWKTIENCSSDCPEAALILELNNHPGSSPESYHLSVQQKHQQTHIILQGQGRGLLHGLYATLEQLGFRFWHPLKPFIPTELSVPAEQTHQSKPYYKSRGFAHHTMHPLELAHVLNAWGPNGPEDLKGWQNLVPEWESYLEWLIAHGQNKVEWVLLEKANWKAFARSPERQQRIRHLVEIGHDWQMQIGIDAPMALEQQNGWRLIPQTGQPEAEIQQLKQNLDWLTGTGLDFVTTEMGTSEFTHGGAQGMLKWLNIATDHLAQKRIPFFTKIHISSGQEVADFKDPQTGKDLNINFLPYYADPRLGIMPHTVQIYALDDPAPTYGHQNFEDMYRFMRLNSGKRQMLWFPETAYWVNYDIHVPLFLPVYARQRWHDMALLRQEKLALDGQIIFSSGWEHGYWLNDLIAAHSAYAPPASPKTERDELKNLLLSQFAPYQQQAPALVELLLKTMDLQHQLLVLGQVKGQKPAHIHLRNGIAYLAGQDTWSELGSLIRSSGLKGYQTQPDRLSFEELSKSPAALQLYQQEIEPLINQVMYDFKALETQAEILSSKIPVDLSPWFAEFHQGLKLNHLRAAFVYALMQASAARQVGLAQSQNAWLELAQSDLQSAQTLMKNYSYRSSEQRLAGANIPNPTAYRYGYLWPAKSLFFWLRDYQQVSSANYNPCLMNIIDPLNIALPDPGGDFRAHLVRAFAPWTDLKDCFQLK